MVTTRNSVVSSIVAPVDPYYLQPLSDEDCWELIAQRALSNRSLDGKEKLVAIGEKIAEKCGGSPLAAKTIGSVLRFKLVESEWEALLESDDAINLTSESYDSNRSNESPAQRERKKGPNKKYWCGAG